MSWDFYPTNFDLFIWSNQRKQAAKLVWRGGELELKLAISNSVRALTENGVRAAVSSKFNYKCAHYTGSVLDVLRAHYTYSHGYGNAVCCFYPRARRVYRVNYTLGWKQTRTKLNSVGRASRTIPPNRAITNTPKARIIFIWKFCRTGKVTHMAKQLNQNIFIEKYKFSKGRLYFFVLLGIIVRGN